MQWCDKYKILLVLLKKIFKRKLSWNNEICSLNLTFWFKEISKFSFIVRLELQEQLTSYSEWKYGDIFNEV